MAWVNREVAGSGPRANTAGGHGCARQEAATAKGHG